MPSPEPARRVIPLALAKEGERVLRICNACRYCEGYCAVFPAMERRLVFGAKDVALLANLCHDCRECYHACQYAPPHEFALDLPRTFAEVRRATYRGYAWPGALAPLFTRSTLALVLAAVLAPIVTLALVVAGAGADAAFAAHPDAAGAFHALVGHELLIGVFGLTGALVAAALVAGLLRCWRDFGEAPSTLFNPGVVAEALSDAFSLRNLHGAGDGCSYPEDVPSPSRRWCHHLTFYGFLLCFASTTVAAIYHNAFGWLAPYPVLSVPVVLGTAGGVTLVAGTGGLLWLKVLRTPASHDGAQTGMDLSFIVVLLLTALTGLALLVLRETRAMGVVLALHLGVVFGLFATMPYGKFVHGLYRFLALAKNAAEARRTRPGMVDERF